MRLTLDGRQHCKFPLRRFDPAGTASCIAPDRNTRLARVRKPRILRRNQAWRRSVLRGAIKRAKPARDGGCSFPHPVRPGGRGKERSSSIGVSYYLIAFFDLKNVDHDGNVVGKMTGLNKGAEDGAASSGGAHCLLFMRFVQSDLSGLGLFFANCGFLVCGGRMSRPTSRDQSQDG